jgi:hypothetical protein
MDCHREAWKPNEVQDVLQTLRKEIIATPREQCPYQRLETGRQVCVCVCCLISFLPMPQCFVHSNPVNYNFPLTCC